MTCRAILRSPSDLIAVIPYQLGFHPRRSVVVAALHGARLGVVQRLDIAAEEDGGAEQRPESDRTIPDATELAAVSVLSREAADGVVVICYEDRPGSSAALQRRLTLGFRKAGLVVRDVYLVRGDRWAPVGDSLGRTEPAWDAWSRVPAPDDVPAVAEWVGLGIAPLPDRQSVHRCLLPGPTALQVAEGLEQLRSDRRGRARLDPVGAWRSVLGRPVNAAPVELLPARVLARAALGVEQVDVRDALIDWLTPGSLPATAALRRRAQVRRRLGPTPWGEPLWSVPATPRRQVGQLVLDSPQLPTSATLAETSSTSSSGAGELLEVLDRLKAFLRRLPAQEQAPTLCMLSCCAWWRGDGALARIAAERAVQLSPEYPLAELLIRIIARGIRWR